MTTQTKIDHDTLTITFERDFAAAREEVFDAWLDPALLTQWWDPTGAPLAACAVDARPGGAFRFENRGSHGPPFQGVYKLLERPAQIVFDAMGAEGTVRLDARGTGTRMTVSIRSPSAEHLAQFVKLGVDVGTARTLDNLVTLIAQRRSAT